MNDKRLHWVDISKGILLYSVILGHLVYYNGTAFQFIFSFHMPAFFILSGYTLKVEGLSSCVFLKKKWRTLLLPYLKFGGIAFFLSLLIPPARKISELLTEKTIEDFFLWGQPSHGAGTTWFLLSLFCCECMIFFLIRYINKKWVVLVTAAALYGGGGCIKAILASFLLDKLPWDFSITLTAFSFVLFGYYLKSWNVWKKYIKNRRIIFGISAVVNFLICIIFGCMLNTPVNMGALTYGNPFYYYISALSGSFMIINIALLLKQNSFWEYFGRNSMIIFAFQAYVYNLIIWIINLCFNTEYIKMKNIPNMLSLVISILAFLLWGCIVWIIHKIQFSIHKESI